MMCEGPAVGSSWPAVGQQSAAVGSLDRSSWIHSAPTRPPANETVDKTEDTAE